MVHEAMVLEYSRPPPRADRTRVDVEAAALRLADRLRVHALGPGDRQREHRRAPESAPLSISSSSRSPASALAAFETSIAKMRVFRVPDFVGAALMLGFLGALLLFVSRTLK